jgi:hypothetical protein
MINFGKEFRKRLAKDAAKEDPKYKILREKKHRVTDSILTYRQINSLESNEMLIDTRKQGKGWRLLSLKDLVFIRLMYECRRYGVRNRQLYELKEDFYLTKDKELKNDMYLAEYAILATFYKTRVTIVITKDGRVRFMDQFGMLGINGWDKDLNVQSFLQINLNEIVYEVINYPKREKMADYPPLIKPEKVTNSTKEVKILGLLRNGEYKNVRVEKRDGSKVLIRAQRATQHDVKELARIIAERQYTDFEISARDGKVTKLHQDDIFKYDN